MSVSGFGIDVTNTDRHMISALQPCDVIQILDSQIPRSQPLAFPNFHQHLTAIYKHRFTLDYVVSVVDPSEHIRLWYVQ
jgi:hypothetical protein